MNERYEFIVAQRSGRRARGRVRGRDAGGQRTTAEQRRRIGAWFAGRVPGEWFEEAPTVTVDDDEVLVVGEVPLVDLGAGAAEDERETARAGRVQGFREETREHRVRIADEAQQLFGRQVSWGVSCGGETYLFTTASVPVMTRLRITERGVLDTLIDAGVARSRSEALAWCVRLVGRNEDAWISSLRSALEHVERARARGPGSQSDDASGTPDPWDGSGSEEPA